MITNAMRPIVVAPRTLSVALHALVGRTLRQHGLRSPLVWPLLGVTIDGSDADAMLRSELVARLLARGAAHLAELARSRPPVDCVALHLDAMASPTGVPTVLHFDALRNEVRPS